MKLMENAYNVNDDNADNIKNVDNKQFIDKDELNIGDLLGIIQGILPLTHIIIATTNKYEHIKESCPALFRYGRLEPMYMDLFDEELFYECVKIAYPEDFDRVDFISIFKDKHTKISTPPVELIGWTKLSPYKKFISMCSDRMKFVVE